MSDKVLQAWCGSGGNWNFRVTFVYLIYSLLLFSLFRQPFADDEVATRLRHFPLSF